MPIPVENEDEAGQEVFEIVNETVEELVDTFGDGSSVCISVLTGERYLSTRLAGTAADARDIILSICEMFDERPTHCEACTEAYDRMKHVAALLTAPLSKECH